MTPPFKQKSQLRKPVSELTVRILKIKRSLLATSISTLGHNIQNQLASLFAAFPGTDNLDSFILCLITGDLDLGSSLLAKTVNGATTWTDHKPMTS